MLSLGTALFVIGSIMANPTFEVSGYVIAVLLVASCLVLNGIYHGALASRVRPRLPIRIYLAACALSIACWLVFWLMQSAPMDISLLAILAAAQGLFWSMWYMRLAYRFQPNYKKAHLLSILAGTTTFLGILLATQSHMSKIGSVTEVACYSAFIGAQVLLTSIYLFRECGADEVPQAANATVRIAVVTTQESVVHLTTMTAARSDEAHAQAS
jgi:MFS family permease